MSNSPRKVLAVQLIDAAGRGDAAAVAPLISDDFILEQMVRDPAISTSSDGTCHDRAAYLGFLGAVRQMTRDGMHLAVQGIIEEGDELAVFGTSDAVSPSGWNYRNAYCWQLTYRGDLVVRMREYYDTALGNRLLES